MAKSFLILGSNLGNRFTCLDEARRLIINKIGQLTVCSSIYETEPWGFVHDNLFLNQVVEVSTTLTPYELLTEINKIEASLGRVRNSEGYAARTMDIDILFYDDLIIDTPDLTIPHPEMVNRRFVLAPLAEIASGFSHPVYLKTVGRLLLECKDGCNVHKIGIRQ